VSSDKHSELELKWAADHVEPNAFRAWVTTLDPTSYITDANPDIYLCHGDNVVRHRWGAGAGQLTVKLRKSKVSITDRVEVDLNFAPDIKPADVTAFLLAAGFKRTLTLFKTFAHVFWLEDNGSPITLALYEVEQLDERTRKRINRRRFLEVESEKGSKLSDIEARHLLEDYRTLLTQQFDLKKPLTESLYEIYSGKRYLTAHKPRKRKKSKK